MFIESRKLVNSIFASNPCKLYIYICTQRNAQGRHINSSSKRPEPQSNPKAASGNAHGESAGQGTIFFKSIMIGKGGPRAKALTWLQTRKT